MAVVLCGSYGVLCPMAGPSGLAAPMLVLCGNCPTDAEVDSAAV